MRNSKNRYFYHISYPGDAPRAITLNVVWMEREFDAYKLPRCMCPSEIERDIGRKSSFFHTPLHSYPLVRGVVHVGISPPRSVWKKLEWCRYPMVRKFRRYLYSFWRNSRTWQTDRRTDRQTPHADIYRAYAYASRGKTVLTRTKRLINGHSEPILNAILNVC